MHLDIPHALDRMDVVGRIDRCLDELLQRPLPTGFEIRDVSRAWSGETLTVAFKAKKGFFGVSLAGTIAVKDGSVEVDADLPGLITSVVGEQQIGDTVRRELARVLGG